MRGKDEKGKKGKWEDEREERLRDVRRENPG